MNTLGYRVLIKPDEIETTYGCIELVLDEKLERMAIQTGTVTAIGPIAFKADLIKSGLPHQLSVEWLNIGDRVLFSKYGGKWIYDPDTYDAMKPDEADQYIIIDDSDVLCVLEEK